MASWARGPGPGPGGGAAAVTDTDTDALLDGENRRLADGLAAKVTRLKTLALDMDRDAEEQNRYLDGMVRAAATGGGGHAWGFARGSRLGQPRPHPLASCPGLGLLQRDQPAEREREALLHHDPLRP
ncbi:BET1-like protein isoform X1 [Monodelphis domestica]|uniref:BET1-like protein isoform X1 n=1 Tax=Monodelphis domestica TaxID=13616 RepID=UPI0024E1CBAF|nr:BET1-like protein isoform X1 [Monodelphis domestica]